MNPDNRRPQDSEGPRGGSSNEFYLAGTRAERALPKKNRRQVDETGVFRKRVRGGRIAKIQKTREGENTCLYCEVCEKYLQDGNSKAAHDKGRDHLRKIEERREQEELETREMSRQKEQKAAAAAKASNRNENGLMPLEQVKKLSKQMRDDMTRPTSFKSWCERSMRDRKPGMENAVQREILYEYSYHVDNGTLLTECWDRRKLASGNCFVTKNPSAYNDPTISEEQLQKIYSEAPMTLDNPLPPVEDDIIPVAPPSTSTPAQGRDYPAVVFVPGNLKNVDPDIEMVSVDKPPPPPFIKIDVSWNLSNHAKRLLRCNNIYPAEIAVDKFRLRHSNTKIGKERRVGPRPLPASLRNDLWRKQDEYQNSFDNEDYQDVELEADYMKLIAEIENYDNTNRLLRACWSMVARINISSMKLGKVATPLSRMMQLYKAGSGDAELKSEFLAHWIMSLLLNEEHDDSPDNYLDMRLSSMPRSCYKLEGVKYGLDVMRSILQNNYIGFMNYFKNSSFHRKTSNRSKFLLDALIPMVRQHALVIWGAYSPSSNCIVYNNPTHYPLKSILVQLQYFDDTSTHSPRLWLAEEARSLIERMGVEIVVENEEYEIQDDGSQEFVRASENKPSVRLEPFINGKAIFGFIRPENCVFLKEDMSSREARIE